MWSWIQFKISGYLSNPNRFPHFSMSRSHSLNSTTNQNKTREMKMKSFITALILICFLSAHVANAANVVFVHGKSFLLFGIKMRQRWNGRKLKRVFSYSKIEPSLCNWNDSTRMLLMLEDRCDVAHISCKTKLTASSFEFWKKSVKQKKNQRIERMP